MRPRLTLLDAGFCLSPEHFVLRNRSFKPMKFPAMFALIEHPKEGLILFDTGYSKRILEETARFPERLFALLAPVSFRPEDAAVEKLRRMGISPKDVRHIIISHFHADHISALDDFPNATFHCLGEAWTRTRDLKRGFKALMSAVLPGLIPPDFESRLRMAEANGACPLPPECAPFQMGFDLFGDKSVLGVPLPGHAHGHLGIFVQADNGQQYFLVGDACWHSQSFIKNVMPHPITRYIFSDAKQYKETLHRIHDLHGLHPDVHVIPSHCQDTLTRHQVIQAMRAPGE